jgi:hypothetical protein
MTVMPSDPNIANRLMLALGGIIIRFADFETDMQGAIRAIHERRLELGQHDVAELPRDQFGKCIKYLRDNVKLAGMEPFVADIERITAEVAEIAVVRNFIAHGTLWHFDEATQTVHFRKYRLNDDEPSHCEITLAELETVRDETAEMAREMFDLAERLQQAFMPDTGSEIPDP